MQVVFLASYPRSGNTWARVLLYHALYGSAGVEPSTREIAMRLPDLHVDGEVERSLEAHPPGEGRVIVKTHFPWSSSHPHAGAAAGVILLVRHPRDVLMSSLNFHRVLETKVKDRRTGRDAVLTGADYARAFIKSGGDPVWTSQGFASWEENTRSWMASGLGLLVVRYEDMLDRPAEELARMLGFVGAGAGGEAIARAVAASSFDRMRALEVREKTSSAGKNTFFGGSAKTVRKGIYFMDRARRGASLEAVGPGLDAEFARRFGPVLGGLGDLGYA
ncbi:MAG: sulfotransferase domain-containing protein [Phycisphaerales bacterium]|nr:sulfotransferase domain-containing protein [Phycisphaerales bacterium]